MISPSDMYHVVAAMVPLYVAMMLGYMWVRWWNVDEWSGINKFVAKLSIPFLSFQVISSTNPYKMNVKVVVADIMQKMVAAIIIAFALLVLWRRPGGRLKWIITGVSLTTLPNTLILGIPLLKAMYGDEAASLVSQLVVLQTIIWYNILLFLFELLDAHTKLEEEELELEEEEEEENIANRRRITKSSYVVIAINVVKKLLRNPNTHATSVGVIWACIHYSRWSIELPSIITNSILIVSQGGLGMAMFSLGLFMASRPSLIACGTRKAIMAMVLKFVAGPALMTVASLAVGLKGTSFKVAVLQAALPQGVVPFVFAKEYNVHPDVLSTGVIFGMLLTLPISLLYYLLLTLL